MAYVETWDETKPAGTRDANLGDDDIREFKRGLTERFRAGGVEWPTTDNANAGLYNYIKFIEQSGNPTSEANRAYLLCKDVSGVTELYWMDSAGTITQLTSGGKILISSIVIASEARGDIITRGASAWGRTAIGTSGKFLRSDGTDPGWNTIQDGDILATILPAGVVVQTQKTVSAAYASLGSTQGAAYDDTLPQNTEGNALTALNTAITPKVTTNLLVIIAKVHLSTAGNGQPMNLHLHQDATANAIAAEIGYSAIAASYAHAMTLVHVMAAGTTSETTFKLRAGDVSGANAMHLNGTSDAGGRKLGGALVSSLTIFEVRV